jgi:hypothetical protein
VTEIRGWQLDLRALYGSSWPDRARFHLSEWLAEAPGRDVAVLLYAIGEVGMSKQIGKLAVLRNKARPEIVLQPSEETFWFEGIDDDPIRFDEKQPLAFVIEHQRTPERFLARERVIDLAAGCLLRAMNSFR